MTAPEEHMQLAAWLRNPWQKCDDTPRGPIPEWQAALMFEAANVIDGYSRSADLAQAAVAAAYEAAAQVCDSGNAGAFWGKAIRALATPDEIAALAAERAATVVVNPLEWVQSHLTSWNDDWHTIPTAYTIRCCDENGWKWQGNGGHGYESSAKHAMTAVQGIHEAAIRSAITITSGASPDTLAKSDDFVSLPRAEVEALMEASEAGLHRDNCPSVEFAGGQCDCGRDDVLAALATLQERMK